MRSILTVVCACAVFLAGCGGGDSVEVSGKIKNQVVAQKLEAARSALESKNYEAAVAAVSEAKIASGQSATDTEANAIDETLADIRAEVTMAAAENNAAAKKALVKLEEIRPLFVGR